MSGYEEEYGELAIVIGDFHIPNKAADLPPEFKELLVPNKLQYVICTGNVCSTETLDWLRGLSSNFHMVKGDQDEFSNFQEYKTFTICGYTIGLIHGHQVIPWGDEISLENFIREKDVDILIYGHTHQQRVSKLNGKFFINPGSVTGAFSFKEKTPSPSFLLLEFLENSITVYLYYIGEDNTMKVDKVSLEK